MDQTSYGAGGNAHDSHVAARDEFSAKVNHTIERAQQSLIKEQHREGYWQAPLEANAEMNAEYIIFNRFMELAPDAELEKKLSKGSSKRSSPTARGRSFRVARVIFRPRSKPTSRS